MRRVQRIAIMAALATDAGGVGAPSVTSLVLPAANWDSRGRAARSGQYGSSYAMAYVVHDDGYTWWRHTDATGRLTGLDPGQHIAELAGLTGTRVDLPAGNVTASSVGALTRAATGFGGSGSTVEFPGAASTGTGVAAAGAMGVWGNRWETATSRGNPVTIPLGQHFTSPAFDVLPRSVRLNLDGDGTQPIPFAIYVGGSAEDPNGGVLIASGSITPNAAGWATYVLTTSTVIPASSSVRVIINGDPANATSYPGFNQNGGAGSDLTDQNLELYDASAGAGGFTFGQAWPAALSGRSFVAPFNLRLCVQIEYTAAPYCSDASRRGYIGVHTDVVLGGSQSDLTGIDPLGANVYTSVTLPSLIGMIDDRHEFAAGTSTGGQMRLARYDGGVTGDADGATLGVDLGQTSGTATDAWVGIDTPGVSNLTAGAVVQMLVRGNGGRSIRYATGGSPEFASPDYDPADFDGSAEFETNSGSSNSTNDAVACEASVDGTGATNPGNLPGRRMRWRTLGITAV